MRFIESLCPPAYLYLLYIVIQVALDISLGMYLTAGVKIGTGLVGVFLLDAFCRVDLGVLSWVIISTPFIITALATSIAMGLQLDKTMTSYLIEKFSPLTADHKKNRDKYVTQLKGGEAPTPSNLF
jgi:galactitol-specific phosphotransferase system IIC component